MILFNNKNKKLRDDFKILIDDAHLTYDHAVQCLQPVIDLYWHHYYDSQLVHTGLNITQAEISNSLNQFPKYVMQLKKMSNNISAQFSKNSKQLIKFKDDVQKIAKWHTELLNRISSLINSIRQINRFSEYAALNYAIKQLYKLEKDLNKPNSCQQNTTL